MDCVSIDLMFVLSVRIFMTSYEYRMTCIDNLDYLSPWAAVRNEHFDYGEMVVSSCIKIGNLVRHDTDVVHGCPSQEPIVQKHQKILHCNSNHLRFGYFTNFSRPPPPLPSHLESDSTLLMLYPVQL